MCFRNLLASLVIFSFSITALGEGSASVDVILKPAGSFKGNTSKVKGFAKKTADGFVAENVLVDLKSLNTGIALRDKHMKDRLMTDKYPVAKLIKASGRDGKGTAIIEVKGKKQEVKGTYEVKGNMLEAKFDMNLPALDIKDIRYMGVGVKDDVTVHVSLPIKEGRVPASKR